MTKKKALYRVVPSSTSYLSKTTLCEGTFAKCKKFIKQQAKHTSPLYFKIEVCYNPEVPYWARRWELVPSNLYLADYI